MLNVFPHEPAPPEVRNTHDRIGHIKKVLQDTKDWQRLGSLKLIEDVAGQLHRCRCGGDLFELSDNDVDLKNLLPLVDVRVTQCWDKFASLQKDYYFSQGVPAHITEAEDRAVIERLLAQDAEPPVSAPTTEPTTQLSIVRSDSASSDSAIKFRGLPNRGNTCYLNTALTALACSRGVPEAIKNRLNQLESQAQSPVTAAQSRILRNLQVCIRYVNNESLRSDPSVEDALDGIRQDLTDAGFTKVNLTDGAQHDAVLDVLFPLLANCLPNFCPENAVSRYSSTQNIHGEVIEAETFGESGLIRIPLEHGNPPRVELSKLIGNYFASHRVPGNDWQSHERTLGEPAPANLVIALDRARQVPDGEGPDGNRPDQQLRSNTEVGLPLTGNVNIDVHRYHIEALGLHGSSGGPNANLHTHGGHYTSFIPEKDGNALGVGTHFSDNTVTAYSDRQHYDHASLERNVTFMILRKI